MLSITDFASESPSSISFSFGYNKLSFGEKERINILEFKKNLNCKSDETDNVLIYTTTICTAMTLCIDIHGLQRMNRYSADPQQIDLFTLNGWIPMRSGSEIHTFPFEPPADQSCHLSSEISKHLPDGLSQDLVQTVMVP